MPTAAVSAVPSRPEVSELVARAEKIAAVAREHALETEQARRVAPDLIALMRDADLFKLMQPRAFGGYEYGFDAFVDIVATIAAGDGSTGWVYSLGAVHQWFIACYPLEAQHEVWDDNPAAIAAVSYAPAGKAEAVPGGYRLSGRFSFASGCDNAGWGIVGAMIAGEGGMRPGFFLVPKRDFTLDDDWNPMGLAGTGSRSLLVKDAMVPAHRVVAFGDFLTGRAPGAKINTNPLYRQPMLAVVPHCLVAPGLGMARGALAAFIEQAAGRSTRGAVAGGNNKMAEFATVQLRVAEATASIDAGYLMMQRDIRETIEAVTRGDDIGVPGRMRNRLTHTFATKLFVQAVDAVFVAMGGSALGLHHPVQRFWRDIHAVSAHISLNWDAVGAMYGQHVFGLEPKGQY